MPDGAHPFPCAIPPLDKKAPPWAQEFKAMRTILRTKSKHIAESFLKLIGKRAAAGVPVEVWFRGRQVCTSQQNDHQRSAYGGADRISAIRATRGVVLPD